MPLLTDYRAGETGGGAEKELQKSLARTATIAKFLQRQATVSEMPDAPAPGPMTETPEERAVVRKAMVRLIPFLFFLYCIAYLDRVNVGFAKLQMNALPWMSESIYGLAAGMFFIGYFLFEVPSNLILEKVGARPWIARIMVSWGLVAMGMLFVNSAWAFYGMRFLLGITEAGFFPGMLLYFTYWFTAKERARAVALLMTANAVTFSLGGPLSGLIMDHPSFGLTGYQSMFLLEGIPAVLMAVVVLWYLPNGPRDAKFLTDREKEVLLNRLEREGSRGVIHASPWDAIKQPRVWILCGIFFCLVTGMYGLGLWIPQTVKNMGKFTDFEVGLRCAIPYFAAGIVMVLNAIHSDRTGERRFHVAIPATIGALGLIAFTFNQSNPPAALACLAVAAAGMWSIQGPFWSLPPIVLGSGSALAAGLAFINSVGNLGGFLGPFAVGAIKDATKEERNGYIFLAVMVIVGVGLVLSLPLHQKKVERSGEPG